MMRVLFDHLQKTGGTALTDFLRRTFGETQVSPLIQHESVTFSSQLIDRFSVVAGHLHLSPTYEPNADIYHLTLLRDPIERFISHYSYVCEQPNATEPFAALARSSKDLRSLLLLDDDNVLVMVKDFYARHFGASLFEEETLRDALSDDRFSGRDLFALVNSRYHLIGITENMNGVAWILSRVMEFLYTPVQRVRVTNRRLHVSDLDASTVKRLRELTARDNEFYTLAKAQFETVARAFAVSSGALPTAAPTPRRKFVESAPADTANLTAELFCPTSDHNDRAISGDPCMLSFAIDGHTLPAGSAVALRITNTLHQLVFRDTRQPQAPADDVSGPFQVVWNFICPFGPGDYLCALGVGDVWVEDFYRFGVDQRPGASWAGLVNVQSEITMLEGPPKPERLMGWLAPSAHSLDVRVGEKFELHLNIGNTGATNWNPIGIYRVVLSYRLSTVSGEGVVEDGLRTMLVDGMSPNEARTVTMRLQAPEQAGHYVITPSFVCERIAWFGVSHPVRLSVRPS